MKKLYALLLSVSFLMFNLISHAQTTHTVVMVDDQFLPANLIVVEGDIVVWENQGAMAHTATSGTTCNADGIWNSGTLITGQTFSFTFINSGNYPYFCIPHCGIGMTGTIVVDMGTGIEESNMNQNYVEINVNGTNPFIASTFFTITLSKNTEAEVELLDFNGKCVKLLLSGKLPAGENKIEVSGNDLSSGTYFLRFRSGKEVIIRKIIKI